MGGKKATAEKKPRRRGLVDDFTTTGTLLGVMGGALLGISVLLPWIKVNGIESSVFQLIKDDNLFFLLLFAQLLGFVCLGLSIVLLRSAGWTKERQKPWSMVLLVLNIVIIAALSISFWTTEVDHVQKNALTTFGSGPYLTIFGVMFSFVGSLLFLAEMRSSEKVVVHNLVSRHRSNESGQFRENPKDLHTILNSMVCPSCGESVSDDMAICPNCSNVLIDLGDGDKKRKRPPQAPSLDDEDLDQVD
jgi:hypothetical protein